ncbi:MAG: hypothetical protein WCC92_09805 [Candidatus Korobacteraceae bacterium]
MANARLATAPIKKQPPRLYAPQQRRDADHGQRANGDDHLQHESALFFGLCLDRRSTEPAFQRRAQPEQRHCRQDEKRKGREIHTGAQRRHRASRERHQQHAPRAVLARKDQGPLP